MAPRTESIGLARQRREERRQVRRRGVFVVIGEGERDVGIVVGLVAGRRRARWNVRLREGEPERLVVEPLGIGRADDGAHGLGRFAPGRDRLRAPDIGGDARQALRPRISGRHR